MKNVCESLKKQAVKKNYSKKKTMKLLTDHMKTQKSVEFVKKKFENEYLKNKKICKFLDHCHYTKEYRGAAHSISNFKCST